MIDPNEGLRISNLFYIRFPNSSEGCFIGSHGGLFLRRIKKKKDLLKKAILEKNLLKKALLKKKSKSFIENNLY